MNNLPSCANAIILQIHQNMNTASGVFLAGFVCAFVIPEEMFNLDGVALLTKEEQSTALEFMRHCQLVGLSTEEMAQILIEIRPALVGMRSGELH